MSGFKNEIKKWIKRMFGVFSDRDLEHALSVVGNAKDREDFQWRLKRALEDRRI